MLEKFNFLDNRKERKDAEEGAEGTFSDMEISPETAIAAAANIFEGEKAELERKLNYHLRNVNYAVVVVGISAFVQSLSTLANTGEFDISKTQGVMLQTSPALSMLANAMIAVYEQNVANRTLDKLRRFKPSPSKNNDVMGSE
jgi:predicted ATP-grasp superfamily ATP-dependent carboligase